MVPAAIRGVFRRAHALVRLVLGPASPPEYLPLPQPSCSASIVIGRRSVSTSPDDRVSRVRYPIALYPFLALWLTGLILLIRQQYYIPSSPSIISCVAAPWDDWPPDDCGLNGIGCEDDLTGLDEIAFRCMGGCRDALLGNGRWIGGYEIKRESLVIGGGDVNQTYRADSWVCAAAIHAQRISPTFGGCVTFHSLPYPEGSSNFLSSLSNGLNSTGFAPSFPGAFRLSELSTSGCLDLHYIITAFDACCLALMTLFLSPLPALLFTVLLILGYFHIVLVSDPPNLPPDWPDILSGLVPVIFMGYWAWQVAFRRTIEGFKSLPFELTLWQGAGYWIGIESSTIFARLPITRLGYDPLDPAGIVTLTIIIVAVAIVALVQAWEMRKLGLLRYYLVRYIWLVPILLVLAFIPNYTLRLHHYLLALAAIPVLSLPNRISLFFQAFMLGLFLDGVGRWGWASIIEYTASLVGDANSGTTIPAFLANATSSNVLAWTNITSEQASTNVTGFSVLIDDIQRYSDFPNSTLDMAALNLAEGMDHYFRLAYIANGSSLDFTDPVTRLSNGSWAGLAW